MTNPMMGLNAAEGRRREEAARQRRERNTPSAEVRAVRARILEEREAAMAEQQAAAQAAREASPDALQAVLSRGTLDELAEIARMISRLDGRRMQDIVNEVFRAKSRTAYVAPVAAEPETPPTPPVVDAPEKAAGESVRRRGRPPGIRSA